MSYSGENLERVKNVGIAIPAILIDSSEVLPEEEVDSYLLPSLGILKNKRNGCTVYVFHSRVC